MAGPVEEDKLFIWEALVGGPPGTPYEFGVFRARLEFPMDYPMHPPKCNSLVPCGTQTFTRMVRSVFLFYIHLGRIPRTMRRWRSAGHLCNPWRKILILCDVNASGYVSLTAVAQTYTPLAEPNDESPANIDAAVRCAYVMCITLNACAETVAHRQKRLCAACGSHSAPVARFVDHL